MQGLKASLDGGLIQRELSVKLHSLSKGVKVGGGPAQGGAVGLKVLVQGLELFEGNGVQQACEVGLPGFTVPNQCLFQSMKEVMSMETCYKTGSYLCIADSAQLIQQHFAV